MRAPNSYISYEIYNNTHCFVETVHHQEAEWEWPGALVPQQPGVVLCQGNGSLATRQVSTSDRAIMYYHLNIQSFSLSTVPFL